MQRGAILRRKDKLIKDSRKDVYKDITTHKESTLCGVCGSVFINGRWTWKKVPEENTKAVCPACRRIIDKFPAGHILIKGDFCRTHKTEILNLIKNVEKLEKTERPMERIMNIREDEVQTSITTTGIHIARRIGEAISKSYDCNFSFKYGDEEKSIRVNCSR
jgi:hypothetical protein